MPHTTNYVLGSDDAEDARLDAQAISLASGTRVLLREAGIAPGMRVLDLGTGLGHVAFEIASVVGERGSVVGIDRAARLLEIAEQRRAAAGFDNVRLLEADVS